MSGLTLDQMMKAPDQGYNEANISKEENKLIDRQVKELEDLLGLGLRAEYTVRFALADGAAMTPVPGVLSVWSHGGREFVDAKVETKLYFCPGKKLGKSDCGRVLPALSNATSEHNCPYCGFTWNPDYMIGEREGRLTRQGWAEELTKLVEELGRKVQIEVVIYEHGIRKANLEERMRSTRGERLIKQRVKKRTVTYRYPSLMRDLASNGNDLYKRMVALLNAAST